MSMLVVTVGSVISIVILFMIFVKDIDGTQDDTTITLTILFNHIVTSPNAGKVLIDNALEVLRNQTDVPINVKYIEFQSDNSTRDKITRLLSNQTPIDIITVDQIWLGEFAERGLLTDLTNYTHAWGRSSDWYEINWDGGAYNDRIYGVWAWADVRGMWYWKDLLQEAGVDPNSLKTWDGYIASAKKLSEVLRSKGIEGAHLVAASH